MFQHTAQQHYLHWLARFYALSDASALTRISTTSSGVNWKIVISAVCMWFLRLTRPPHAHLEFRSLAHK